LTATATAEMIGIHIKVVFDGTGWLCIYPKALTAAIVEA